jgi:hypothetical protein
MFRRRRHRLHLSARLVRPQREQAMLRQATIILAALALAGLGALRPAQADEMIETRIVMHATSVQTQDVGDVDGHVLGLIRASGIASFQDGSTATAFFVAQTDYVKGSGTNSTFSNLTFNDGSELWYKPAPYCGEPSPCSAARAVSPAPKAKADSTAPAWRRSRPAPTCFSTR